MRRTIIFFSLILAISIATIIPVNASQDSDSARDQAKKILSDSRYEKQDQPLEKDIDRLGKWIGNEDKNIESKNEREDKQIEDQYDSESPNFDLPNIAGLSAIPTILLFLLIACVVLVLGYVIYRLARLKKKSKTDEDKEIDLIDIEEVDWKDENTVLENISDVDQLEKLSVEAENSGRLDIALRYRYRAGLLRLNEKGIITFNKSTTNAQWQLEISNPHFDDVTKNFNDVTYGEFICSSEMFRTYKNSWAQLLRSKK